MGMRGTRRYWQKFSFAPQSVCEKVGRCPNSNVRSPVQSAKHLPIATSIFLAREVASPPAQISNAIWLVPALSAVCLAVFVCSTLVGADTTSATKPVNKSAKGLLGEPTLDSRLISVAVGAVTERLTSPRSIEFPDQVSAAKDYAVAKSADAENLYVVSSWMNTPNRFGAQIRSDWKVGIRTNGQEIVSVDSVKIDK